MKRKVLNYLVIAALAVSAACTSNKIDDVHDVKGLLKINEKDFPITGAYYLLKPIVDGVRTIKAVSFEDEDRKTLLFLNMNTNDEILKAKTYTANEIKNLGINAWTVDGISGDYDYWDNNAVMKVDIEGEIYNIIITGHATKNEYETEYTMTYTGKIELIEDWNE